MTRRVAAILLSSSKAGDDAPAYWETGLSAQVISLLEPVL